VEVAEVAEKQPSELGGAEAAAAAVGKLSSSPLILTFLSPFSPLMRKGAEEAEEEAEEEEEEVPETSPIRKQRAGSGEA
jgi:hypothetical protein